AGDTQLVITGSGEADVVIAVGREGVTVSKGVEAVTARGAGRSGTIDDGAGQVRGLLSGRTIAAFRQTMGVYERRLLREASDQRQPFSRTERDLEPYGYSMLLSAALISELSGDPSALDRIHELIVRRIVSRLQVVQAGFQMRDCVSEYERYLLSIDT